MSSFHHFWCDNIHTTVFTPRDYQVELLAAAYERNTVLCLGHRSSKEFIALKLLQESARQARSTQKTSIYLTRNLADAITIYTMLQQLTDLRVCMQPHETSQEFRLYVFDCDVYILHPSNCLLNLREAYFSLKQVNLIVIEDCHEMMVYKEVMPLFSEFYNVNNKSEMPKILGLGGPLHSAGCALQELSAMLNSLEESVHCQTETASDIVTVLRYCSKPIEYIAQCAPMEKNEFTFVLENIICTRRSFLNNHRYDPSEIYNTAEFIDELKDIPDPKKEPMQFLDNILTVLHEMGPWCADRVSLNMFRRIEHQKIKTPHERHYLLLCLVNTSLLEIHALCEQNFRKYDDHKKVVEQNSSPKVLRLLEILRDFKPEEFAGENENMKRLSHELDDMDFQKLTRSLEISCQNIESNLATRQQLEAKSIVDNLDTIVKPHEKLTVERPSKSGHGNQTHHNANTANTASNHSGHQTRGGGGGGGGNYHARYKRRPFVRRQARGNAHDNGDSADTLCALIFCNSNYTARVLFDLLCEMSRHDAQLKFLLCQFTTDRIADPVTEAREAEIEHRRQEEVLKRFRMHDCNVLIGTSILEEGIDLPKCNLVVRWDPPTTYRSYVQCKGKARAPQAYHIMLVAPKFDINSFVNCSKDQLSDRSHRYICKLDEVQNVAPDSDSNDECDEVHKGDKSNSITIGSSKGTVKILNPEIITGKPPSVINDIQDDDKDSVERLSLTEIIEEPKKMEVDGNELFESEVKSSSKSSVSSDAELEPCSKDSVHSKKKSNSSNNKKGNIDKKVEETVCIKENGKCENEEIENPINRLKSQLIEKGVPDEGFLYIAESYMEIDVNIVLANGSFSSNSTAKSSPNHTASLDDSLGNNKEILATEINRKSIFDKPLPNQTELDDDNKETSKNINDIINDEIKKDANIASSKSSTSLSSLELDKNKDTENALTRQSKAKAKKVFQCSVQPPEEEFLDQFFDVRLTDMEKSTNDIVEQMAQYREIEKMLIEKCSNVEPPEKEHELADKFTDCIEPYKTRPQLLTGASVDLSTSIALVNKYCSKLPSDTFTKLTPLWRCAKTERNGVTFYQYTLRLPINSPLKYDIVGIPMFMNVLARRMAALQACIELYKFGELDKSLQPIGKEGFRAIESDWENFKLEPEDEKIVLENSEPRPGTTKRRQYYYKRIASEFCDCRPVAGTPCYLYFLDLKLECPIPEEQNTRGRRIYPPEEAQQGFGILTLKHIPKVSSFPIFTRSGEVKVSIVLAKQRVILTEVQVHCINTFVNYTFTNVLRLQKFLMLFDPDSTENCVFIVPTMKTKAGKIIDWGFLEVIEKNIGMMPTAMAEEERQMLEFDANKFKDAVVMPWYRNQDQPQYFYVAEICPQLSPLSCFPGENYNTFKDYYFIKYGLNIQNTRQPLLDVDHTSARLNFLTPRYVNRKGVALPTSSEETKRAKRENLEQKQILVPELCTVHPFPASLWRTAVCLPCILYRINGLLLADDIRKKVSADISLGKQETDSDFEWPILNFGWSFSEVLKKSRESQNRLNNDCGDVNAKSINADAKKKSLEEEDVDLENGNGEKKEKSANEIIMECERKLLDDCLIEIGTWSNEMANNISDKSSFLDEDEEEEFMKCMPSNVSFCDQQPRYGSPTFWGLKDAKNQNAKSEFGQSRLNEQSFHSNGCHKPSMTYYNSDDSLTSCDDSDDDWAAGSYADENDSFGRYQIAFNSKNEAEILETEEEIEQRNKQMSIIQATTANERIYQQTKNLKIGYNFNDIKDSIKPQLKQSIAQFLVSTKLINEDIRKSGMLVECDDALMLPKRNAVLDCPNLESPKGAILEAFFKMFPYVRKSELISLLEMRNNALTIEDVIDLNLKYVKSSEHDNEVYTIIGSGDVFDNFNDKNNLNIKQNGDGIIKEFKIDFEAAVPIKIYSRNKHFSESDDSHTDKELTATPNHSPQNAVETKEFSFDYQPNLCDHPGPSPSIILQALTMSNANDGINLERLETIGDSFLKYAITTYLYITYENVHEGKLSHLRSKQVANLNLYRLGRRKQLGEYMIATKFEPHDNWLPPCYYVPKELEKALIEAKIPPHHWKLVDLQNIKELSSAEICELVREKADKLGMCEEDYSFGDENVSGEQNDEQNDFTCFIPYNLVTQHSIPDKSIADCVEALIGAYLIECGPRGALLFMAWLGIRVLPFVRKSLAIHEKRVPGSTKPDSENMTTVYGEWTPPKSPLLLYAPNPKQELECLLDGFEKFEQTLGYKFRDRSYLLQAMTHASYSPNRLTDCYQRLEFLGDAVLDYLITRHLYESPYQHSPGALTDLRSALVNNTIFASLAVRHGFHKYFRHLSPALNEVIDRFVRIQNENGHSISEEYYLLSEEECDDAEDVEVPKALGDVFESVAGAIFLDSGMSLDMVWQVYSNMMKPEIDQFSNSVPKSPIRELLELEPETAKFGKPEKLADGRRVRVSVEVFCKGTFRGIGRNYRIAKCTAAKCALRQLKKQGLLAKRD